jgi:hypothetical protein
VRLRSLFAAEIAGLIIITGIGTGTSTATTDSSIVITEGTTRIPVTTDNNRWK